MASGKIEALYNDNLMDRTNKLMYDKCIMKLNNKDIYSIYSVKKSLMLGAKLQLEHNALNRTDSLLLFNFIEHGGMVDNSETVNLIFNLIAK